MGRILLAVFTFVFGVSQGQAGTISYSYAGADLGIVAAQSDPGLPSTMTYPGLDWGFTYDEAFLGVSRANARVSLNLGTSWSLSIDNGTESLSMTSRGGGFSSVPDPSDPYWIMDSLNPVIGGLDPFSSSNVQGGSLTLQFDAMGRLDKAEASYTQAGDFHWYSSYDRTASDYQSLTGSSGIICFCDYVLESNAKGTADWLLAEAALVPTPLPASAGLLAGAFGLLGALGWAGRRRVSR